MGTYICNSCSKIQEADSAPECCGALMEEKTEAAQKETTGSGSSAADESNAGEASERSGENSQDEGSSDSNEAS